MKQSCREVVELFQDYRKTLKSTADPNILESKALPLLAAISKDSRFDKVLKQEQFSPCVHAHDLDWKNRQKTKNV